MDGGSGSGSMAAPTREPPPPGAGGVVAPLVAKTYRMVDDATTGRGNNSFVIADPFVFARTLLPANFKHSNFSSFVRQLNTYGFRKVDPDRWEFAHASFLRGQTHLLHRVVRRRSAGKRKADGTGGPGANAAADGDAAARLAMEVVRLKREQKATEERAAAVWRRVQETERRPRQMLAFLVKAAGDPQALRRVLLAAAGGGKLPQAEQVDGGGCGEDGFDFTGLLEGGSGDAAQAEEVDAVAGVGEAEGGCPYTLPADSGYYLLGSFGGGGSCSGPSNGGF